MIANFHTHRHLTPDAILSVEPQHFNPQPGQLYSVGIHPWNTNEVTVDDLRLLDEAARHPQVVAIGETGLDALRGAPLDKQIQIFEHHLQLAELLGKPVVIHSVRTSQQVLKLCRNTTVPRAIHGMRSNERVARPLIDAGFYLSFGSRFNHATVAATPLDKILIETDDDDLSITDVAQLIAPIVGISVPELIKLTAHNTQRFISNIERPASSNN